MGSEKFDPKKFQKVTLKLTIRDGDYDREYILTSPTGRSLIVTLAALDEWASQRNGAGWPGIFEANGDGPITLEWGPIEWLMERGVVVGE